MLCVAIGLVTLVINLMLLCSKKFCNAVGVEVRQYEHCHCPIYENLCFGPWNPNLGIICYFNWLGTQEVWLVLKYKKSQTLY